MSVELITILIVSFQTELYKTVSEDSCFLKHHEELFWTCKPVLRCRLSKAHIWLGKPQGARILEWGGNGEGMEMGRSVYEQPGTKVDRILSQQGGLQVSKVEGEGKQREWEKEKAESKGIAP